jgi:hypothetical protein
VRYLTHFFVVALAACATPEQRAAQDEREYGLVCDKQGYARDSEKWRACVVTEGLNASLATQRKYDEEMQRKRDCVSPLQACTR